MKYTTVTIAMMALIGSTSAFSTEYIVKLKQDATLNKSLNALGNFQSLNLSYSEKIFKLTTKNKLNLNSLKSTPQFEYIEENLSYKHFGATPEDADFGKQWGLNNDGKNSGSWWSRGVEGVDISALKAWGVTRGDASVKIAVIDTGVDYNHPDLKANMMVNTLELNGTEGVDDDGNGYVDDIYGYDFANKDGDPMDGHGHGTHCAGVIGASHDSKGIAGVMGKVQILAIKFLTDQGGGNLDDALLAIDYAVARGVNVMSNSWGGGGRSQALYDAIERAKDAGILFTAAAGNAKNDNDANPTYPANYKLDNVLTVGALDGKGKKASFSNFGKKTVHVFAPGVDIYSTVANGKYKKMSGTSMATPHVSGVAGLIWANEPNLTFLEVKQRMMGTTINTTLIEQFSVSGYVDAFNALTNLRSENR
jgi:thermitase